MRQTKVFNYLISRSRRSGGSSSSGAFCRILEAPTRRTNTTTKPQALRQMSRLSAAGCVPLQTTCSPSPAAPNGLRAVSLRSATPLSGPLRSRKRGASGVRRADGHTAARAKENFQWGHVELQISIIGWCRCVAARANGPKSSAYAAKFVRRVFFRASWWCATRECFSEIVQRRDSKRST